MVDHPLHPDTLNKQKSPVKTAYSELLWNYYAIELYYKTFLNKSLFLKLSTIEILESLLSQWSHYITDKLINIV